MTTSRRSRRATTSHPSHEAQAADRLIGLWTDGRDRRPYVRAALMLAAQDAGLTPRPIARLSVGERDSRLLALLERQSGAHVEGYTRCPACGVEISVDVDLRHIRAAAAAAKRRNRPGLQSVAGLRVRLRAPTHFDVSEACKLGDVGAARRALLRRCVVQCRRGNRPVEVETLTPDEIAGIASALERLDPGADIRLSVVCAACGTPATFGFDPAEHLWAHFEQQAKQLIHEVAQLARTYGWRERDILAMSRSRRGAYLHLADG